GIYRHLLFNEIVNTSRTIFGTCWITCFYKIKNSPQIAVFIINGRIGEDIGNEAPQYHLGVLPEMRTVRVFCAVNVRGSGNQRLYLLPRMWASWIYFIQWVPK